MAAPCSRKRNTGPDSVRQKAKKLLARHREPGSLANALRSVERNKQSNNGHQANGLRLPGQRILFHEDQERLSRQSVKNHFSGARRGSGCANSSRVDASKHTNQSDLPDSTGLAFARVIVETCRRLVRHEIIVTPLIKGLKRSGNSRQAAPD